MNQMTEESNFERSAEILFCRLSTLGEGALSKDYQHLLEYIDHLITSNNSEIGLQNTSVGRHECKAQFGHYLPSEIRKLEISEEGENEVDQKLLMIQMISRIYAQGGFFPIESSESFKEEYRGYNSPPPPVDFWKQNSRVLRGFVRKFNKITNKTKKATRDLLTLTSQYFHCLGEYAKAAGDESEQKGAQNIKQEIDAVLSGEYTESSPAQYVNGIRVVDAEEEKHNKDISPELLAQLPHRPPYIRLTPEEVIWDLLKVHEVATINNIYPSRLFNAWKGEREVIILRNHTITLSCRFLSQEWMELNLKREGEEKTEPYGHSLTREVDFSLFEAIDKIAQDELLRHRLKIISGWRRFDPPIIEGDETWEQIHKLGTPEEKKKLAEYVEAQEWLLEIENENVLHQDSYEIERIIERRRSVEICIADIEYDISLQKKAISQIEYIPPERRTSIHTEGGQVKIIEDLPKAELICALGTRDEIKRQSAIQEYTEHIRNAARISKEEHQQLTKFLEEWEQIYRKIRREQMQYALAVRMLGEEMISDKSQALIRKEGTDEEIRTLVEIITFSKSLGKETRKQRVSKKELDDFSSEFERLKSIPDHITEEMEVWEFMQIKTAIILPLLQSRKDDTQEATRFFGLFQERDKTRAELKFLAKGLVVLNDLQNLSFSSQQSVNLNNAEALYAQLIKTLPYQAQGSSEFISSEFVVHTLLERAQMDIKIIDGNGSTTMTAMKPEEFSEESERLYIHIWSSPEHEIPLQTIALPNKIFGETTNLDSDICLPGSKGQIITDEESGFIVGQIIDNHLFVLLGRGAFTTEQGWVNYLKTIVQKARSNSEKESNLEVPKLLIKSLKDVPPDPETEIPTLREELSKAVLKTDKIDAELVGEQLNAKMERFAQEFDKIMNHEKVERIYVSDDLIVVRTHTLFCRDPRSGTIHRIGRFKITVLPHYKEDKNVNYHIRWLNLDGRIGWEDMYAPHVDGHGKACMGNQLDFFRTLLKSQQYYPIITQAIRFVESANTGDYWGKRVHHWPKARRNG